MKALVKGLSLVGLFALAGCGGAGATSAPPASPTTAAAKASAVAPASASAPAVSASSAAKPSAVGSRAGAKDKVRAGYLSFSSTASIEFISKGAGLYDKYGLDVDLQYIPAATLTTALNAGKDLDVGYASAANIPTVNVKGGDLTMLAASAQGGIFSIDAGPGIKSVADLKGKRVAVMSIGSTTDLLLRQVLQDNKLVPNQDVGVAAIPDNAAMVAALSAHQVDAGVTSEPFTSIAVSQGATVIYDQAKTGAKAIQTPVTVKRGYIAGHRDLLKRLLMANMEAVHMIKTDPAAAAKVTVPFMKMDDITVLQHGLEGIGRIMDPDMNIPLEDLANSLKIAAANVPEVATLKPEDLVDLSIQQEIKSSGFVDKLYQS
jgi:NitT/TauT family transport system substrate-binding protein